eukprot:s1551_g2.t1
MPDTVNQALNRPLQGTSLTEPSCSAKAREDTGIVGNVCTLKAAPMPLKSAKGAAMYQCRHWRVKVLGGAESEMHRGDCEIQASVERRPATFFIPGLKTVDGSFPPDQGEASSTSMAKFQCNSIVWRCGPGSRDRFQLAGGNSNRRPNHCREGALQDLSPFLAVWHLFSNQLSLQVMRGRLGDLLLILYLAEEPLTEGDLEPLC